MSRLSHDSSYSYRILAYMFALRLLTQEEHLKELNIQSSDDRCSAAVNAGRTTERVNACPILR
jgi:hypothetical protein